MAKGQKRGNREPKKPKTIKVAAAPAAVGLLAKGSVITVGRKGPGKA